MGKTAIKVCPGCEKEFSHPVLRGRPRVYCSDPCKDRHIKANQVWPEQTCAGCKCTFRPHRSGQAYCAVDCAHNSWGEWGWNPKPCGQCGGVFTPEAPAIKYCSAACRRLAHTDGKTSAPALTRAEMSAAAQNHAECEHCSVSFTWTRKSFSAKQIAAGHIPKFCSVPCAAKAQGLARRKPVQPKIEPPLPPCSICAVRPVERRRASYCGADCREIARQIAVDRARGTQRGTFTCRHCDTQFERVYGVKRRTFCSDKCAQKHHKSVRKAMTRAPSDGRKVEKVTPLRVFKRDGWRCHICGGQTDPALRGTCEPDAPELEHIIPLSKGGDHSYANTACAHRRCNQEKGDTLPFPGLTPVEELFASRS